MVVFESGSSGTGLILVGYHEIGGGWWSLVYEYVYDWF